MRKLIPFLFLFVSVNVCCGRALKSKQVDVSLIDFKNAIYVRPGDNLPARYNWLKSSARDGKMGTLSATNRRSMILTDGTYDLTDIGTWVLDTNFVDVGTVANNNPNDVIVMGDGSTVVTQTANDICLSGFTIKHNSVVGSGHGFLLDATDNSPSRYMFMKFIHEGTGMAAGNIRDGGQYPVCSYGDIHGFWWRCESEGSGAWYPNEDSTLGGEFWYCRAQPNENDYIAGERCFGGDKSGANITAKFYYCEAFGVGAFGGCSGVGIDVEKEAEFWHCKAGNNAYGYGKKFKGKAYYSTGWLRGFAGTSSATYKGSIEPTAWIEGCSVTGDKSFGCGEDKKLRGTIINCYYPNGYYSCDTTALTAAASLTTDFTDPDANLKFSARNKGIDGNDISIEFSEIGKGSFDIFQADLRVLVQYYDSNETASDVITEAASDPRIMSLVSVQLADGSDGTGYVEGMAETNLSDGANAGTFRGNCFDYPIDVTESDYYVWPILNGQAYTNAGAAATVTLHMPAARTGLQYPLYVKAAQQLRIDPNGTDTIAISGTQQAAGKYIWADAIGESCMTRCVKDGEWETETIGTWTVEP